MGPRFAGSRALRSEPREPLATADRVHPLVAVAPEAAVPESPTACRSGPTRPLSPGGRSFNRSAASGGHSLGALYTGSKLYEMRSKLSVHSGAASDRLL